MHRRDLLFRCLPAPVIRGEFVACALLLAACSCSGFDYQSPAKQAINEYRPGLFGRSVDDVWSASLEVVEANEQLTLVLAERDMGLIVIKLADSKPASLYVDCGLIDGKDAIEAFRGAVKPGFVTLYIDTIEPSSTKLKVQSAIHLSAGGSGQTRVRIDSTYDLHVDTGAWNQAIGLAGHTFSRNWSFATGGQNTQAFEGKAIDIEPITCRPTHALERRLLQDIEESLAGTS